MNNSFIAEISINLLRLTAYQTHALYCNIKELVSLTPYLCSLLNKSEQAKANEFHFIEDKQRYILARGLLRVLLGCYLDIRPENLQFNFNMYGKPYLIDHDIHFNISHSKDMVLFAFNRHNPVGVDIEYSAKKYDIKNIAKNFFSEKEYQLLKNLDALAGNRLFYDMWTAKESYIKAIGMGLSFNLADIEFSLGADNSLYFATNSHTIHPIGAWHLHQLHIFKDYAAALMIKGKKQPIFIADICQLSQPNLINSCMN
jgi:4'-phosphopantetheinyl transferase